MSDNITVSDTDVNVVRVDGQMTNNGLSENKWYLFYQNQTMDMGREYRLCRNVNGEILNVFTSSQAMECRGETLDDFVKKGKQGILDYP